jgi:hypothetical protein
MRTMISTVSIALVSALAAGALAGCSAATTTPSGPTKTAAVIVGDSGNSNLSNGDKYEAFLPTDSGATAPHVTVSGATTTIHRVESITRDAVGNVFVGDNTEGLPQNLCTTTKSSGQVLVFGAAASGNVAPAASISGSNTTLDDSIDGIALDSSGDIFVSQKDTTADVCAPTSDTARILMFAAGASGNVAATKRIIGANTLLNAPRQLVFDAAGRLWAVDERAHDVVAFNVSALAAGDNNIAPVIEITSASFHCPQGIAIDASNDVFVSDSCAAPAAVYRFNAITSNCLVCVPNDTITGLATTLGCCALQLATDGTFIYVGNDFQKSLLVFNVTDNGNVAPARTITDSTASMLTMRAISL